MSLLRTAIIQSCEATLPVGHKAAVNWGNVVSGAKFVDELIQQYEPTIANLAPANVKAIADATAEILHLIVGALPAPLPTPAPVPAPEPAPAPAPSPTPATS